MSSSHSSDSLNVSPSPTQITTHHSSTDSCFFTSLSGEMISGVLRHLDTVDLIQCAQVTRLLNMLAVQCVLDQHLLWRPESVCTIRVSSPTIRPPDVLSALLISVHIRKMTYLSLDLTKLSPYLALEIPLIRLTRLINRMESVNDVAFHFGSGGASPQAPPDKELKRLYKAFADLFNALTLKSCTILQFENLERSSLGWHYTFKRNSKSSGPRSSIFSQFKGYLKNSKDRDDSDPPKPKQWEEEVRYGRITRMSGNIHILSSPQVLELSKLVRLDTSSTNLFRPPFSAWSFPMLHSSRITHFSIGLGDLPTDKEESQFILNRLASALPDATLLTLYSVRKTHVDDVLVWFNSFAKTETLSLPLDFPLDFSIDKLDLRLPELWRLECAPALLSLFFEKEGKVVMPNLKSVAITQHGVDLPVLAECIEKARDVIKGKSSSAGHDCRLFLAIRLTELQIKAGLTPALREGIRPKLKLKSPCDLSEGFQGVSFLEISLPGTREEIRLGIFDNEVMGLLTMFPDVKSLLLSSSEWYLRKPPIPLEQGHRMRFRQRSPGIYTVVVY